VRLGTSTIGRGNPPGHRGGYSAERRVNRIIGRCSSGVTHRPFEHRLTTEADPDSSPESAPGKSATHDRQASSRAAVNSETETSVGGNYVVSTQHIRPVHVLEAPRLSASELGRFLALGREAKIRR